MGRCKYARVYNSLYHGNHTFRSIDYTSCSGFKGQGVNTVNPPHLSYVLCPIEYERIYYWMLLQDNFWIRYCSVCYQRNVWFLKIITARKNHVDSVSKWSLFLSVCFFFLTNDTHERLLRCRGSALSGYCRENKSLWFYITNYYFFFKLYVLFNRLGRNMCYTTRTHDACLYILLSENHTN